MNVNRIKELRLAKNITQEELGKVLNVQKAAISKYENGRVEPSIEVLKLASKFFDVSTDYLLGRSDSPIVSCASPSKEKTIRIPILGRVAAGNLIGAIEEIIGWEEIPKKLAAGSTCFALRVCDRSMEPRILAGDTVIIRQQPDVDSGDIAVVLVGGEEATVKRVKKQKDGITLIATNTTVYEPHFYSNQEIKNLPIQILGKVVEVRYKP